MSTKATVYNLTLSSLLLSKEVTNPDTDTGNEVRVLNMWYDIALESTIKDLDLDGLSSNATLELITELFEGPWKFAYKYPTNCAKFRRIKSNFLTDNNRTHIAKRVAMYTVGTPQKAIFTNEYLAVAEYIPKDISLAALSPMAIVALSKRLAVLAAPLITGKGAARLIQELEQGYVIAKMEAQEDDKEENFNYEDDSTRSEFVAARME